MCSVVLFDTGVVGVARSGHLDDLPASGVMGGGV